MVHGLPERTYQVEELVYFRPKAHQQRGPTTFRPQQVDVFGEGRENAAHQEVSDPFGRMAGAFQRTRESRQTAGHHFRDLGAIAAWVKRHWVQPDLTQALAHFAP